MTTRKFLDDDRPKQRDDEEREKKSWRELDAQRDRSRHLQPQAQPKARSFEIKRDTSKAKAALESLFSGKRNKEQEEAWKELTGLRGRAFSDQATAYTEKHGLPFPWDDLLRLLDHDDPAFLGKILDRMVDRSPHETEARRDLLRVKLRILKMEREEPELISRLEAALAALGS